MPEGGGRPTNLRGVSMSRDPCTEPRRVPRTFPCVRDVPATLAHVPHCGTAWGRLVLHRPPPTGVIWDQVLPPSPEGWQCLPLGPGWGLGEPVFLRSLEQGAEGKTSSLCRFGCESAPVPDGSIPAPACEQRPQVGDEQPRLGPEGGTLRQHLLASGALTGTAQGTDPADHGYPGDSSLPVQRHLLVFWGI